MKDDEECLAALERSLGAQPRPDVQLRVAATDVDALLSVVGELVLAHGRLTSSLRLVPDSERRALAALVDELPLLYAELRERLLRLRLVPIAPLVELLSRSTGALAQRLGKAVRFESSGVEQALDTKIVEGLRDPFLHLLHNAIDHGIEPEAERIARGKPAAGTISLRFEKHGEMAVFELADDGRGLDRERIAAKARERGRDVQASALSEADLLAFLFEPGFSTAHDETEGSGRGAGMDMVRQQIQALRGSIRLRSQAGEGTTFTVELPLDVTIVDCLLVESANQNFVLPQERVLEFIDVESAPRSTFSSIRVREQTLPCIRLATLLGGEPTGDRETVLVLSHANGPVALSVERSHGVQETVVRPVGPLFSSLPLVAGAAVLGSGDVALLLDIDQLVASCLRRWTHGVVVG